MSYYEIVINGRVVCVMRAASLADALIVARVEFGDGAIARPWLEC